MKVSRRHLLSHLAGVAGCGLLAGCSYSSGYPEPEFELRATPIRSLSKGPVDGDQYLIDPFERRREGHPDYSDSYKRDRIAELTNTGQMTTRDWRLTWKTDWGRQQRDHRACFEYNGAYYRIRVEESTEYSADRWQFWLEELAEGPPQGATVERFPLESISEQDRRLVTGALEDLSHLDDSSPSGSNDGEVGFATFHTEFDPASSALVPEPPFEYLQYGDVSLRAVTGRPSITGTERTFTAEQVADSEAAYEQYAKESYPDGKFSEQSLSTDAKEILDTATESYTIEPYEEEPPLSDALEEVIEPLGIAERFDSHSEYDDTVRFEEAVAEYDDDWYEFEFQLFK